MSVSKEAVQLKNQSSCEDNPYLPMFPVPRHGQISSEDFLVALKSLTNALDHFGKIFIAIKYDIQKTLEKLTKFYELNEEKHSTLQKMLLEDKKSKTPTMLSTFTWLRKNLQMIQLFFEYVVNDYSSGKRSEDIVAPLNKAYGRTLESYHECMSQQLFGLLFEFENLCDVMKDTGFHSATSLLTNLLCRTTLTLSEILKNIANGSDVTEDVIIDCMDKCSRRLKENIKVLKSIFEADDQS